MDGVVTMTANYLQGTNLAFNTIVFIFCTKIFLWYHTSLLYGALYIDTNGYNLILYICCIADNLEGCINFTTL